jgi:EAL domain-containing protein (putative c-di-GMP-specific phosphodiesterase class I)
VLELTETALLQAANSTLSALRQLREEGVGITIDRFGSGYASLRYLTALPVSAVKIDRSFTTALPHDQRARSFVGLVAGRAADLRLGCVVDGVETPGQRLAQSANPGCSPRRAWAGPQPQKTSTCCGWWRAASR